MWIKIKQNTKNIFLRNKKFCLNKFLNKSCIIMLKEIKNKILKLP